MHDDSKGHYARGRLRRTDDSRKARTSPHPGGWSSYAFRSGPHHRTWVSWGDGYLTGADQISEISGRVGPPGGFHRNLGD